MSEVSGEVVIRNSLGMHARPAMALAKRASEFESEIYLLHKDNRVNAKSIMGLLTLAAHLGSRMMVSCNGPDAPQALEAIQEIFDSGFGEP